MGIGEGGAAPAALDQESGSPIAWPKADIPCPVAEKPTPRDAVTLAFALLLALGSPASKEVAPGAAPAEAQASPTSQSEPVRRPALQVLAETEERLLLGLFAISPWLAFERGWPDVPTGIGRCDPDVQTWWTYVLESSAGDLDALRAEALPANRRADLAWLRIWLRAEATLSFSRAPHRWNPAAYVERAQRVFTCLRDAPSLTPEQRSERGFEALTALPALWETARRGLSSPSSELSAEAIQRLLDLEGFLERDLAPRLAQAPWTEVDRRRFQELVEDDLRQSLRFRNWLAEKPLLVGGPVPPMGALNWESIVRGLTGTELDAAQLKSKLLREVSNCDRRLGARRALPKVPAEERTAEAIAARVRASSRDMVALLLRAGVFERLGLPWEELMLETSLQPGPTLPGPLVHSWPAERGQLLVFEAASTGWPPAAQATRNGLLSEAAQRALAIRHGVPGEALLRHAAARSGSRVERFLWNRASIEGWGLYMLDLLARLSWVENPLRQDEAFQAEAARILLVEAARLLAALEIHVQEVPLQSAAEAFRNRTGFDEVTSFHEVRRVFADPLQGIGVVVLLELRGLENELLASGDRGAGITSLLEPLLARPSTRPADLRAELLRERER